MAQMQFLVPTSPAQPSLALTEFATAPRSRPADQHSVAVFDRSLSRAPPRWPKARGLALRLRRAPERRAVEPAARLVDGRECPQTPARSQHAADAPEEGVVSRGAGEDGHRPGRTAPFQRLGVGAELGNLLGGQAA